MKISNGVKNIFKYVILLAMFSTPMLSFALSNITGTQTQAETDITDTSVKFHGSTNTNGETDFGYFRYTKVLNHPPIFCPEISGEAYYGSIIKSTFEKSVTTNSGLTTYFDSTVTGLEPDTQYAYCAIVSNSAVHANITDPTVIRYGMIRTFTTAPCATCDQVTINTNNALVTNGTSGYLNGFYNSTFPLNTYFEYSLVPSGGGGIPTWTPTATQTRAPHTSGTFNAQISGLSPNTAYQFRAVGNSGTAAIPVLTYGDILTFTTGDDSLNGGSYNGGLPPDGTAGGTGGYLGGNCSTLQLNSVSGQVVMAGNGIAFPASVLCQAYGDVVTYSATGLPTGATLNPTSGVFNWVTSASDVGTYTIVIGASTPSQTAAPMTVTIQVVAEPVDCTTLTINPIANQQVTTGAINVFYVTTCGALGTKTFSADTVPTGATLNPTTGLFSWTPAVGQEGPYTITVHVSTPTQIATPVPVHINVVAPNTNGGYTGGTCTALALNSVSDQIIMAGNSIAFASSVRCATAGETVTYNATGLPTHSTFNSANGIFNWPTAPSDIGTHNIVITASTPSQGTTTPMTVSVQVVPVPGSCTTLTINPIASQYITTGNIDTFYEATCGAVGAPRFTATHLPTHASLDSITGVFVWTPAVGQEGTYDITFNASTRTQTADPVVAHIVVVPQWVWDGNGNPNQNNGGNPNNGNGNGNPNGGGIGGNPNGNGTGNGNGNQNNGGPLNLPQEHATTAPIDDVVHYGEGVENVFIRQIVGNIPFAKIYGYQDGMNITTFAYGLAHTFAQLFGYVHGGAHEIRVTVPDKAAYQLGSQDHQLVVFEYYDGRYVGTEHFALSLKSAFGYEYYFTRKLQ